MRVIGSAVDSHMGNYEVDLFCCDDRLALACNPDGAKRRVGLKFDRDQFGGRRPLSCCRALNSLEGNCAVETTRRSMPGSEAIRSLLALRPINHEVASFFPHLREDPVNTLRTAFSEAL